MQAHVVVGHLLTSPLPLLPLLMLLLNTAACLPKADRWWCGLLDTAFGRGTIWVQDAKPHPE